MDTQLFEMDLYKNKMLLLASYKIESGSDLLSRAVASQVSSAQKGLTSVFGMGTGGSPSLLPPEIVYHLWCASRVFSSYLLCLRTAG